MRSLSVTLLNTYAGFLKKACQQKSIVRQQIEKIWLHGIKKTLELNDLLLNLCSTQKWNTNIRCRRMIPWNPEFTVDLPRMKAKIVWVTVTSLLYCLARKKEKNRLAALKIHACSFRFRVPPFRNSLVISPGGFSDNHGNEVIQHIWTAYIWPRK